jgi:hypothetical protein
LMPGTGPPGAARGRSAPKPDVTLPALLVVVMADAGGAPGVVRRGDRKSLRKYERRIFAGFCSGRPPATPCQPHARAWSRKSRSIKEMYVSSGPPLPTIPSGVPSDWNPGGFCVSAPDARTRQAAGAGPGIGRRLRHGSGPRVGVGNGRGVRRLGQHLVAHRIGRSPRVHCGLRRHVPRSGGARPASSARALRGEWPAQR